MGRPDAGKKCVCMGCSARFYDLHRASPLCPKCGILYVPEKPRSPASPYRHTGLRHADLRLRDRPPTDVYAEDEAAPAAAGGLDDTDVEDDADDADVDVIDEADAEAEQVIAETGGAGDPHDRL